MDFFHYAVKLNEAGRFADVPVRAEIVSTVDVGGLVGVGENEANEAFEGRVAAKPKEDLEAIDFRHFQVQQEELGKGIGRPISEAGLSAQVIYRLLAIAHEVRIDWQVEPRESADQKQFKMSIVISYEHNQLFQRPAVPGAVRSPTKYITLGNGDVNGQGLEVSSYSVTRLHRMRRQETDLIACATVLPMS